VAGECAALHSSRRHDHAPVADSGRNHESLVQSFAPHFVCDLLHRDFLSCEYILRFGRIDSGRTRVLVATSSFAPPDFRKHQRRCATLATSSPRLERARRRWNSPNSSSSTFASWMCGFQMAAGSNCAKRSISFSPAFRCFIILPTPATKNKRQPCQFAETLI